MNEQTSLFDEAPDPVPTRGRVTGARLLDRVQVKIDGDDPLYIYRERLRTFFGKDGILQGDRLWITWAGSWTYCLAVQPEDQEERERGIVYIYRAIYEEAV